MKKKLKKIIDEEYSKKRMNDICPKMFECRNQNYNWDCFGKWRGCKIYVERVDICPEIYNCKNDKEDWRCCKNFEQCDKYNQKI